MELPEFDWSGFFERFLALTAAEPEPAKCRFSAAADRAASAFLNASSMDIGPLLLFSTFDLLDFLLPFFDLVFVTAPPLLGSV
jgi:hypothetical protein